MTTQTERYTAVAIVLHWAIAAAVLFMLPLGFVMHERAEHGDASQALFEAYQLHKSIGLTVLTLTLLRLMWRLTHRPPPLAAGMPAWERVAARVTHWGFYVLTLALPLTGWLYVSAGWSVHDDQSLAVPTRWFGLFQVPHVFGLTQAGEAVREETAHAALTAHAYLGFMAIGLIALHVAAALKHHFFDRDETLAHMVPGIRAPGATEAPPRSLARSAFLGAGLAAIALALVASVLAVADLATTPVQEPSRFDVAEEEGAAPVPADSPALSPADPAAPAAPGAPSRWTVDGGESSITFGYVYEDESGQSRFNGRFTRWRADIRFDPNNLDASTIVVRIETASAQTGVAAHDSALPTAAWFNAGAHPAAEFRSTRIRARGEGRYEARGDLTIRGQTQQVDVPFTLNINGDRASVSGGTSIDRRDFGIGREDAGDELISRDIQINVRVEATRAP
jgi:cytochrome b561/polyisoprenoid-binding protein YceI